MEGGGGNRSEISFIMFTSGYLLTSSNIRERERERGQGGDDLQPSDYRFGSRSYRRCSFHSDRILPHGRSKQWSPPNRLCLPSTGHLTRKERHRFRLCSPSQSERINRITHVPARALQFGAILAHPVAILFPRAWSFPNCWDGSIDSSLSKKLNFFFIFRFGWSFKCMGYIALKLGPWQWHWWW